MKSGRAIARAPSPKPMAKRKTSKRASRAADVSRRARPDRRAARAGPATLKPVELARLLGVPAPVIRGHIEAGAPVGPDGRVNLVHYAAWLVVQLAGEKRSP